MQFVDTSNPNPVASRNAEDITLTGISSDKVTITIKRNGTALSTFVAEPYSGSLTIRLSDILRSILQPAFHPSSNQSGVATVDTVTIEASAPGQHSEPTSWSRFAVPAGYDKTLHSASFHSDLMSSYWWTWRDQKCRTFAGGKEFIGGLFSSGTTVMKVTATFSDGTSAEQSLYTITVPASEKKLCVIDVSYARISALFPAKTVVSYRVVRGESAYAQEYELSRIPVRGIYIFRNGLGLLDTVYATGHTSDGTLRDVTTFIGEDRQENIADNSSREHIYANSGHIGTSGERTLWREFLQSPDTWIYENGAFQKIIVDAFDMKLRRGVSESFSFDYHYSDIPSGNGYIKSAL